MCFHLSIFVLMYVPLEFYSENTFLCIYSNFPTLFSIRFRVSGLMKRSLIHLEFSLYRVRDKDLLSFFYINLFSLTSTSYWRWCFVPGIYFVTICQIRVWTYVSSSNLVLIMLMEWTHFSLYTSFGFEPDSNVYQEILYYTIIVLCPFISGCNPRIINRQVFTFIFN